MLALPLVFVGQNSIEPTCLALRHGFVPEAGSVIDDEFLTAAITAQNAHLHRLCNWGLFPELTFLNGYGFHGESDNFTSYGDQ